MTAGGRTSNPLAGEKAGWMLDGRDARIAVEMAEYLVALSTARGLLRSWSWASWQKTAPLGWW